MPGIVMEVSATFVAMTISRCPCFIYMSQAEEGAGKVMIDGITVPREAR